MGSSDNLRTTPTVLYAFKLLLLLVVKNSKHIIHTFDFHLQSIVLKMKLEQKIEAEGFHQLSF